MFKWLLYSSEDPTKISMTIKGYLTLTIPMLLFFSQAHGWGWSETTLMTTIQSLTVFIGGFFTSVGLIRKLYSTAKANLK